MIEQRLLNDDGIAALKELTYKSSKLIIAVDPDTLAKRVQEQALTEDIWGNSFDLDDDILVLNNLKESGPGTDADFSRIIRRALPNLRADQGLDEYMWATVNCFVISDYVRTRWKHVLPSKSEQVPNYVRRHWLDGEKVTARQNNAIARLWWLGEFSDRAAQHSALNSDELLEAMANNVNLYHQLLSRPNLLSRSRLVAAIYEVFLDDNDYLRITKYANELLESLNLRAAGESLDLMDLSELREVVEESKPPKER